MSSVKSAKVSKPASAKASNKNGKPAKATAAPAVESSERKRPSFFAGARKRDSKGLTLKDRVAAYWDTHREATAGEIATAVKADKVSTVSSWIGCFRQGYGFPIQFLRQRGLLDKMNGVHRAANVQNGEVEGKSVQPVLVDGKLTVNGAVKAPAAVKASK